MRTEDLLSYRACWKDKLRLNGLLEFLRKDVKEGAGSDVVFFFGHESCAQTFEKIYIRRCLGISQVCVYLSVVSEALSV